ncbi:50S ribosomal protein L30 [Natranaerobius thermophilus]|uniref:Large ribosomal subunit protein uL30 n=1 Tax=Natranaerobius thermophilus (strain ATCC BAA-1301 / DSM 18059 / JW/NM-WN-LF) TaxID=457570 RepID=RL30_NATTJ|nr:50S ribosomal protein L30 [Natranaerobius thermophilus]B2A4F7.1 RecName: Full=Large ribosomal subunit protein uL30; AltName: Full=50S ribosomal protein L30 [Natranaerobius thermophilus JW/NM-WN-LF]ACB83811.1 LSU ribosomal protein L30P [Natranaerobius thermophilus JW/NM-WN-LF]
MADKKLKVTLKRGLIGVSDGKIRTIKALGLKKRSHSVIKNDTPEIRGMIDKVSNLVEVEELEA